jgi:hypothetical protein
MRFCAGSEIFALPVRMRDGQQFDLSESEFGKLMKIPGTGD